MGAWGHQSFENDSALDWVSDFEHKKNKLRFLEKTFQQAIAMSDDYLEVDEGSSVIAAAEVLAALKGKAGTNLPPELATWVSQQSDHVSPELTPLALQAIAVIKNVDNSEIAGLWEEAGDGEWLQAVTDLELRLQD
jgi:hypothetical protein